MEQDKNHACEGQAITWHPAFVEAIKLELEDYRDVLEFLPEYQLTSEPLRIDCVIIKKEKNAVIRKNIAAIFREINLLEYKSPDDYVSVEDFYKVYSYACLYASFEKMPVTSITISFIESRYPKTLLAHLREVRKFTVEETSSGIYTVTGDIIPIQLINSRRLSAEENLWLRDLRCRLAPREMRRVLTEISRQGKGASVGAYLDAITRANKDILVEALNMTKTYPTMEEILREVGMVDKWEAIGKERKALDIAQKMISLGLPFETIVSATELDPEKVKAMYQ